MKKTKKTLLHHNNKSFPVIIEQGEDGHYLATMPLFDGCYTQGKTIEKALDNIREVIELCLEEKENKNLSSSYNPQSVGLFTVTLM